MVKDVVEDKQQHTRREDREATIERVFEMDSMGEEKAPGTEQKQRSAEYKQENRAPCNILNLGFLAGHGMSLTLASHQRCSHTKIRTGPVLLIAYLQFEIFSLRGRAGKVRDPVPDP